MKRILITGVAGLIGSNFCDWLIKNTDNYIIGIDNLSGGYLSNINKKCKFYKTDLSKFDQLNEIFKNEKPNIVYHFAAYAAEGLSPFIRSYNYQNNVINSANLITLSIEYNIEKFVFTSSMAVYGDKYKPPFDEKLLPEPIDPYGIGKYAVELDLKVAKDQHGLNYTIIRPHNVYGIKQNVWDRYRNVLGIWMYQLKNNMRPTIYGDGSQKRAFTYIDDIMLPLWNSVLKENCNGEIINLGGIQETSILEAYNILSNITKRNIDCAFLEKRHEAKYAWSTWNKSENLLDFKHTTTLDRGLEKMWNWFLQQPHRERIKINKIELNKGIYNYWKK